jgi:hypothetical protein
VGGASGGITGTLGVGVDTEVQALITVTIAIEAMKIRDNFICILWQSKTNFGKYSVSVLLVKGDTHHRFALLKAHIGWSFRFSLKYAILVSVLERQMRNRETLIQTRSNL